MLDAGDVAMNSLFEEDTIVAVATPRGRGAVGIVRLSGPRALEIVGSCLSDEIHPRTFTRVDARLCLASTAPFPVVLYVMLAPRSYTREDVVEIHAPGSPALLAAMLAEMRRQGARLAEPGEFTRRAFLNGRVDLAQAEAVMALIRAGSDAEERLAVSALRGELSSVIRPVRERLVALAVDIEAGLDFVEEEVTFATPEAQRARIDSAAGAIARIIRESAMRRTYREETVAVLYGTVNAGKSSIFNCLVGSSAAIVEATPGTTRDFLEAEIEIEGAHFLLIDTAGVRGPAEIVEQIAVERSERIAREAQVLIFVVDSSQPLSDESVELYRRAEGLHHIVVLNKADLAREVTAEFWRGCSGAAAVIEVSAKTGVGVNDLELALAECVFGGGGAGGGAVDLSEARFLLDERQHACLEKAAGALERAARALAAGAGDELVVLEVREAVEALGEVTGQDYVGDLLDEVFSRFCIGK